MRAAILIAAAGIFVTQHCVLADDLEIAQLKRFQRENDRRVVELRKRIEESLTRAAEFKKENPRQAVQILRDMLFILDGQHDSNKFMPEIARLQAARNEIFAAAELHLPDGYVAKSTTAIVRKYNWPATVIFSDGSRREVIIHGIQSRVVQLTLDGTTLNYPSWHVPRIRMEHGVYLYDWDTYFFVSYERLANSFNELEEHRQSIASGPVGFDSRGAGRRQGAIERAINQALEFLGPEGVVGIGGHLLANRARDGSWTQKGLRKAGEFGTQKWVERHYPDIPPSQQRAFHHLLNHCLNNKATIRTTSEAWLKDELRAVARQVEPSITEYALQSVIDSVIREFKGLMNE